MSRRCIENYGRVSSSNSVLIISSILLDVLFYIKLYLFLFINSLNYCSWSPNIYSTHNNDYSHICPIILFLLLSYTFVSASGSQEISSKGCFLQRSCNKTSVGSTCITSTSVLTSKENNHDSGSGHWVIPTVKCNNYLWPVVALIFLSCVVD